MPPSPGYLRSRAKAEELELRASLCGHWVCLAGADLLRAYLLGRLSHAVCPDSRGWSGFVEDFLKEPVTAALSVFSEVNARSALGASSFRELVAQLATDSGLRASSSDQDYTIIENSAPKGSEADLSIIVTGVPAQETDGKEIQNIFSSASWRDNWDGVMAHGLPLAVCAQRLMMNQPARRFVVTFSIRGHVLRVFTFDRCGVMYSDEVDFHVDRDIIVYAALLTLADPASVGIDTTIVNSPTGCSISLPDPTLADPTVQDIGPFDVHRIFWVFPLVDRGTTCWKTQDGRYIIKDFWRQAQRVFEGEHLVKLFGVKGVGQLRAYQDHMENVSALRGGADRLVTDEETQIPDRVHCRQVLDAYTGDLSHAPNPLALLIAFRDAVIGHRNALIDKQILHRDVSLGNLMFDENARDGLIGRLIDFDFSITLEALWAESGTCSAGTPIYKSSKLLAQEPDLLGPHDHMDDLESFFYVLLHISIVHNGTPRRIDVNNIPKSLANWDHADAADGRMLFLLADEWSEPPSDGLREPFLPLLEELRAFFRPRTMKVRTAVNYQERVPGLCDSIPTYLDRAERDYERFLEILDDHIDRIKRDRSEWEREVRAMLSKTEPALDEIQASGRRSKSATVVSSSSSTQGTSQGGEGHASRKRKPSFSEEGGRPTFRKRLREEVVVMSIKD